MYASFFVALSNYDEIEIIQMIKHIGNKHDDRAEAWGGVPI